MWEIYYSDIDGLIFMVDSTVDIEFQINTLSKRQFNKLLDNILDNKYLKKSEIPVLICINKIDKVPFEDFKKLNNLLDFVKLNKKSYNVLTVSALQGYYFF